LSLFSAENVAIEPRWALARTAAGPLPIAVRIARTARHHALRGVAAAETVSDFAVGIQPKRLASPGVLV
jgi:hypothetical protein